MNAVNAKSSAQADGSVATTKPLAVVTGASSGIGLELAKQFAANDFDLIIGAEGPDISACATDIRAAAQDATSVHIQPCQVDLSTEAGVEEFAEKIREGGRIPDAVALNAGIGAGGAFVSDTALKDELKLIDTNVRGTVHLAKLLLPDMVGRGEGRVLFTSSEASTMPGPFQAVYNASKSFVQSFSLALREELKDSGVTVTSLMPGATDTNFFKRADLLDTRVGASKKDSPEDVARDGFEAMMAGEERVVAASLKTKAQVAANHILPDSVKAKMHRKLAEPGSARR